MWFLLLAIAFTGEPAYFYLFISAAALAVFSVLARFVFAQYRCYLYAKKAIRYGANAINYFVAARATEDTLKRFERDEYSKMLEVVMPRAYKGQVKARRDKIDYYYSCLDHCKKRQDFYLKLLHAEGMDYRETAGNVLAASSDLAELNPAVAKMRANPKARFSIDDIVNAMSKVED
jgi:hypothetical protein